MTGRQFDLDFTARRVGSCLRRMNDVELLDLVLSGIVIALVLVYLYFELFVCGGTSGTLGDVPRVCWWFR